MRIVVDTNVVVSGLLFGGAPLKVLRAASLGIVDLFTSNALVAEFSEVIERPHLDRKFSEANATRRRLVSDYQAIVTVVNVAPLAERVSRDFDDDEVLACALAADCEFIVTGDKDLLVLSEYRGIRILNPTDFLAEIEL
ncbi:MAG TPA: putative toxin-antitoxin system toxin component, PIN family [Pyrinomonadaceae bacterium]|mgnify:FL=1|nr:putative toxin-antitoxin system toxin component, PIN family [Chloracidobacterium sp.]MBK9439401.1 putative toxin-antitoxin system toxin component, PIN family [Chloracidobacterium sp.]MBL0239312.1 putative toxin-antitoxin system toxin component, PIN family [Chloracidobacterium sp.]MBP9936711.1 putative toxin-antitoxin system toxin component, PIN family [Pyrinomonadaceae bacterium]HQX56629.1 putative toxin-antitoxin system toxin component, PIN family [Pyrinomonadaceae bacterium]